MGEFLSVPNKEKVSEDGESTKVIKLINLTLFHRSNMQLVECKDGEKEWKIPTFPI